MATAENAKLQYEAGQNAVAQVALTDSGDRTTRLRAVPTTSSGGGGSGTVPWR